MASAQCCMWGGELRQGGVAESAESWTRDKATSLSRGDGNDSIDIVCLFLSTLKLGGYLSFNGSSFLSLHTLRVGPN